MARKRKSQYDTQEIQWDDEELQKRIEERRRQSAIRARKRKMITLIVIIVVFTMLGTMCGKDIVRLKAENRALRRQQIALEEQRDELQKELKNANNQEYIREQAKKQLRLLNPGEILFTFDEEEEEEKAEETKNEEKKSDEADKAEEDKDKDGGSDG